MPLLKIKAKFLDEDEMKRLEGSFLNFEILKMTGLTPDIQHLTINTRDIKSLISKDYEKPPCVINTYEGDTYISETPQYVIERIWRKTCDK